LQGLDAMDTKMRTLVQDTIPTNQPISILNLLPLPGLFLSKREIIQLTEKMTFVVLVSIMNTVTLVITLTTCKLGTDVTLKSQLLLVPANITMSVLITKPSTATLQLTSKNKKVERLVR
jgi:hypothetical protein